MKVELNLLNAILYRQKDKSGMSLLLAIAYQPSNYKFERETTLCI